MSELNPNQLHPLHDRTRGALLGLSVGDALGTTLEFKSPGSFTPIENIVGQGPFNLRPGEWTDDTSMALCIAASILECKRFDPEDQMNRFLRWRDHGYMSSNGRCFDIGNTISRALHTFESTGNPLAGSTATNSAGNGSIMRLAPVPIAFVNNPSRAIALAAESSRTTHGAITCIDACRYMAALIIGALQGRPKNELLAPQFTPDADEWNKNPLTPEIASIADGSFKIKNPPQIRGTGYVVDSLEAALWAFHHSDDFKTGALLAVNLGDDADTTGAVFGQIAGAYYGEHSIPRHWMNTISRYDDIKNLADQLHAFSIAQPSA